MKSDKKEALLKYIIKLLVCDTHCGGSARFKIGPVTERNIQIKGQQNMSLILKDDQKVAISVKFTDAVGNAAKVDGIPVWASSDVTIATVTPSDDGLSAVVATVGPLGSVQVSVTADADTSEGIRNVIGTLDIDVVADEAVSASLGAGTPESRL